MENIYVRIIVIITGILLILFRRPFIEGTAKFQQKVFHINYSENEKKLYRGGVILFALLIMVVALLNFL